MKGGSYGHYFALEKQLRQSGCRIERREAVWEATGGRTSSLRETTSAEYAHLIDLMRAATTRRRYAAEERMRRKVIALFRKMGYECDGKADMRKIYAWAEKYGKYHKPLNGHNGKELSGLVSQVESMYQSFLRELHRELKIES